MILVDASVWIDHLRTGEPVLAAASTENIMRGIEQYSLYSRGTGWVDAGLFIACINYPCRIWTKDGNVSAAARERGLLFVPE